MAPVNYKLLFDENERYGSAEMRSHGDTDVPVTGEPTRCDDGPTAG